MNEENKKICVEVLRTLANRKTWVIFEDMLIIDFSEK